MALRRHLEVGYVARAHGLAGELAVKTFDPESETLFQVRRVLLRMRSGQERELLLETARATPKEVLVSLAGIDDRTAAQACVGATVLAFREDLGELGPGEYFLGDLVGLDAVDASGRPLGRVEEIWSSGPVPNLVIRSGGSELLVPFADEFVSAVDLESRRVVVRPPEYTE